MTIRRIRIFVCDACAVEAEEGTEDGWCNAIYTHGCPAHASLIEAHRANVTSETRGRGRNEKTTWYLSCACGWHPRPAWASHTYSGLTDMHLVHVQAVAHMAVLQGQSGGDHV